MSVPDRSAGTLLRATARGLVAAMAMTGIRTVTANVGLVYKSPPEAVVDHYFTRARGQRPREHRTALTEVVHWTYGAAGGTVFGLLPAAVRAHPASGPVYGLAVWLGFEAVLAPLVGVQRVRQNDVAGRLMVAVDHIVYGVVVAGRLAPDPAVTREQRAGHR